MSTAPFPVQHERLPWPLGLTWVAATRAQQALGVFGAAELAVRVLFAMVLTDVLDLEWAPKLEQRLKETRDRGLERMSFGTRVDLLRLVVKLHAGAPRRVLPDLQGWWKQAEGVLLELAQARNQVTHLAQLEEAPPEEPLRLFAQLLAGARWLPLVQLVHVTDVRRERGRFATHLYRLRGVAPWTELAQELDTSFASALEGGSVYLGNAAGTAWALAPFFSARPRSVAVFDGLDAEGRPLFLDPTKPLGETLAREDGFPLPGQDWRRVPWLELLEGRRAAAEAWRLSEPKPDVLLQVPVSGDATLAPGTRLDFLELVQPLGEGGFATVWEAEDVHTRERVAVKVLRPGQALSERDEARFEEEAGLLRRLKAQGCRRLIGPVEVFRVDLEGARRLVLRMPLLRGTVADAAKALRSDGGKPSVELVTRWGTETLEALADLHARGVVHRDIKPSNLLLDAEGHVVLTDLGLARDLERDARITRTGEAIGSDLYMAPEQRLTSRPVTGKADLYALAVTLHELLVGEVPAQPGKGIEGPLGEALRQMSSRDPEERPDTTAALALVRGQLALRSAPPRRSRRSRWLAVAVLLLLALLGGAWLRLAPGRADRGGSEERRPP